MAPSNGAFLMWPWKLLKNQPMVEAARTEARLIIEDDPNLSRHPTLKAHSAIHATEIHFE